MRTTSLFRAGSGRVLAAPLAALALLVGLPACAQQNEAATAGADAPAQAAQPGDDSVVGRVMGEEITLGELESGAADQLEGVDAQLLQCQRQAEQGRYQVLQSALEAEIRERLVAAEAAEAGQTPEQYLAANLTVAAVTDADVENFYTENQARIGRPLDQISGQIRQYLEQQKRAEAEQAFYAALAAEHEVAFLLEPPRTEVAATGPAKGGPANAPVTIVEFSDFECPFCSRVNPTLAQVQQQYGDKVRIVFRHFPLNIHPNAQKAAEASMCANDQGKFWEMHDLMFAEQRQLTVENLKEKAARLELDTAAFNQCLDSGEYADEVQADLQAGMEAGVSGTPAMFVNGIPVSGAVPFEQIAPVIDAELQRKGAGQTASN